LKKKHYQGQISKRRTSKKITDVGGVQSGGRQCLWSRRPIRIGSLMGSGRLGDGRRRNEGRRPNREGDTNQVPGLSDSIKKRHLEQNA